MNKAIRTIPVLLACLLAAGEARGQQCETPNMMIVLDRSGSMSGTKWTQAKNAIDYIVNNYGDVLRFGLDMFPSDDYCGAGNVQVDVGDGTGAQIMSTLNATSPDGNTPMAATLMVLNQYRPLKDMDRRNFVMLVSDGDDTCASDPDNDPVQATADLYINGIRTFVIGFGSGANPTVLNNIASAGHTGTYHQADDQAELQAAMDQIVNEALVEICDDRDNDCDNLTDEPWPEKGELCTVTQGLCSAQGVYVCNAAQDGIECNAVINPTPEVCDGVDNDCNGLIDDGFADEDGDTYNICTDCCDSGSEPMQGCTAATAAGIHPGAVESCNGYDDDCDGAVDEDDPQLGELCGECTAGEQPPCYTDVGECQPGSFLCVDGVLTCVGEINPENERCDLRDNDCDGQTDETLQQNCSTACGPGIRECIDGQWTACSAPQPTPELCDDVDNDCDGDTDEDFPLKDTPCSDGLGECFVQGTYVCTADGTHTICSVTAPQGTTEICDGKDNNCNGVVDESDPQLGQPCGTCSAGEQPPCYTDEGECQPGSWFCVDGSLACLGEIEPREEICDGLDNDCDGLVDENAEPEICDDGIDNDCDGLTDMYDPDCGAACQPGEQEECGTSVGDCEMGVRTCGEDGQWGPCEGGVDPSPEVCDGRDNDCDGLTDEDAVPEICDDGIDNDCDGLTDLEDPDCGECTPGDRRSCGSDVGECLPGQQTCTAEGTWSACEGAYGPFPEECDGRDNDCDGVVDEGNLCDDYDTCLCGMCASPCSAGECPAGNLVCVNGWCVSDPCCGVGCPPGEECDASGWCVDRCETEGIQCPDGEDCRMGICVPADCFTPGYECDPGEVCLEGACQPDPCAGVDCGPDAYCRHGLCEQVGCVECGPGQVCEQGACVDSPCAGVQCQPGQVCIDGQCAADPCTGVYCPVGTVCLEGTCLGDPCAGIACPDASRCLDGWCVEEDEQQPDGGAPSDGADGGEEQDGQGGGDRPGDESGADAGPGDAGAGDSAGNGGDTGGCGCGPTHQPGHILLVLLVILGMQAVRRGKRGIQSIPRSLSAFRRLSRSTNPVGEKNM